MYACLYTKTPALLASYETDYLISIISFDLSKYAIFNRIDNVRQYGSLAQLTNKVIKQRCHYSVHFSVQYDVRFNCLVVTDHNTVNSQSILLIDIEKPAKQMQEWSQMKGHAPQFQQLSGPVWQ